MRIPPVITIIILFSVFWWLWNGMPRPSYKAGEAHHCNQSRNIANDCGNYSDWQICGLCLLQQECNTINSKLFVKTQTVHKWWTVWRGKEVLSNIVRQWMPPTYTKDNQRLNTEFCSMCVLVFWKHLQLCRFYCLLWIN